MGEEPERLREAKSKLEYLRYGDGNFTPLDSTDAEALLAEVERLAGDNEQLRDTQGRVQKTADTLFARAGDLEAQVERLGRDNAAIRTCYYPAPQYVKIEMERDRLRGEVKRLAGERDEYRQQAINADDKCERLAGERDTLRGDRARADAAAGTNHTRAVKAEIECERLAGRVAARDKVLNAIFDTELNGRLCALPESLDEDDDTRESRCCDSCRRIWEQVRDVLANVGGSE